MFGTNPGQEKRKRMMRFEYEHKNVILETCRSLVSSFGPDLVCKNCGNIPKLKS